MGRSSLSTAVVLAGICTTANAAQELFNTPFASLDNSGGATAIDKNTAVVGVQGAASDAGLAHVLVMQNGSWSLQATLVPNVSIPGDLFGCSVDLDGDTCVIGGRRHDFGGTNSGAAWVFVRNGTTWTEQARLVASNASSEDEFGNAVSVDGPWLAVAANRKDTLNNESGAVYIFARSNGVWVETNAIVASDSASISFFGDSVSLDGSVLAVGATGATDQGLFTGATYLFTRDGGLWPQIARLTASDPSAFAFFGTSVSLDGGTLAIGAVGDDRAGSNSGAIYTFVDGPNGWAEEQKLILEAPLNFQDFGRSVSLDGDVIVAGAPGGPGDAGTAHVFARSAGTWHEQGTLSVDVPAAHFGEAVAFDGRTAVIGAPNSSELAMEAGAAYAFDIEPYVPPFCESVGNDPGCVKLIAPDADSNDELGLAVQLDGTVAILGSPSASLVGTRSGVADIFTRTIMGWQHEGRLVPPDLGETDSFGFAVDLSGDIAVVGAPFDDDIGNDEGAVHVFRRIMDQWEFDTKLVASDGMAGDRFGTALSFDGSTLVVGADGSDSAAAGAGAVYVFEYDGGSWLEVAKLVEPGLTTTARLGSSVSVEGNVMVAGARGDDVQGINSGKAFLYANGVNGWELVVELAAPGAADSDNFGAAVSIFGEQCAIGAWGVDEVGQDSGAVFVWRRSADTWVFQTRLAAFDMQPAARFGRSVSMHENRLVVGAEGAGGGVPGSGAAYVFETNGVDWSEHSKLVAADAAQSDRFGRAIAGGTTLVIVGAPQDNDNGFNTGSAYAFTVTSDIPTFCVGDGGDTPGCTPCPCDNDGAPGATGGCLNSAGSSARLSASGTPSVSLDTVRFIVGGATANTFAGLVSADRALPIAGPCPAGSGVAGPLLDGLRCIGGGLFRHGTRATDSNGNVGAAGGTPGWGPPSGPPGGVTTQGGFTAGQTRYFQVFYRDNAALQCGTGQNTTNGKIVLFRP